MLRARVQIVNKVVGIALLGLVSVLSLIACTGPDSAQEYFAEAQTAKREGRTEGALVLYKNALLHDPNMLAARLELGELYQRQGDQALAENYLRAVVDGGYQPERALPALASVYLQQNQLETLHHLLEQQLNQDEELGTHPNLNQQLSLYQVLYLARSGKLGRAQSAFSVLGSEAKQCELGLFTQAQLQSFHTPAKALLSLQQLIAQYPDNAQAYLLRGQLQFTLHQPTEAYNSFRMFQSLQPTAGFAQFLLAISAMQMKNSAAATVHVDRLLANNPHQPLANHLKAILVFADGDHSAAKTFAEQSIHNGLRAPTNYVVAGISAYHLKKFETANQYLRKALGFFPQNAQLQRLLLVVQVKLGSLVEAQESFVSADMSSADDLLFGNAMTYQMVEQGQFSAASNMLAYLKNTPAAHPAIRLQTLALESHLLDAQGLGLDAIESVQVLSNDGRLAEMMVLIQGKVFVEAQQRGEQWLSEEPENIDALNVMAYLYQKVAEPTKAQTLYALALSLAPNNTPSLLYSAQLASQQRDYPEATRLYQLVLSTRPSNLAALQGLLKLSFVSPQPPNFTELLQAIDLSLATEEQIVAIADAMFQWRDYVGLEALLQTLQQHRSWSDMLWMLWLKNNYHLNGPTAFSKAYRQYRIQNTLPDHAVFALSILEQNNQPSLALTLIAELDEQTRQLDGIKLAKASALIELKQDQPAEAILRSFASEHSLPAAHWYIWGRIMEQRKDLDQATSYLSAYYRDQPGFHSLSHLSRVLRMMERTDELAELAKEYVHRYPGDTTARLSLAFKLVPKHNALALSLVSPEHVRWSVLQSWQLSFNVASIYLLNQDPNGAMPFANNALTLNPASESVQALHGQIKQQLKDRANRP